jgi:hypothetical protein
MNYRGVFPLSSLFFLLLSVGPVVRAAESISTTIHHQYQSARALGMGDAFTAVASDYSAIFYNPAGLARRENGQINLSIDAAVASSFKDFADDLGKISSAVLSDSAKQTAYFDLIQKHYGDVYSLRLTPLQGVWVRPHWGIAFIPADISVELAMHKQVGPSINATLYADSTLAYSYAKDVNWINKGRMSLGVTGKFVNRAFFSKAVSATELATNNQVVTESDLLEGYTLDADLGLLWTPEIPGEGFLSMFALARPTFGAVVHNIAESGFGSNLKLINKNPIGLTGTPEKLYRVLDVGSKWEYPNLWIFGGRGVLDVRDIGHPNWNWSKGLHAGLEFDWKLANWWKGHYRAGINQGFWTAGLSAEFGFTNLDLVSYADNVGTFNTPIESRVYALKMNLDF